MRHSIQVARWLLNRYNQILLLFVLLSLPLVSCASATKDQSPSLFESQYLSPPLSIPFFADKAGERADILLRISSDDTYWFALQFVHKKNDWNHRAKIREITGDHAIDQQGKYVNTGVPIHLRIKIIRTEDQAEKVLVEKESFSQHAHTWDVTSISKLIAQVQLSAGTYRVVLESLKEHRELRGTVINFTLGEAYLGK